MAMSEHNPLLLPQVILMCLPKLLALLWSSASSNEIIGVSIQGTLPVGLGQIKWQHHQEAKK